MNDPWPAVACVGFGALIFCYYWLLDVRGTANLLGKKVLDRLEIIERQTEPKKQPERPEHYHIEVYETKEGEWGWNVFYHSNDSQGSYAMRWDAEAKGFKTNGYNAPAHAFTDACQGLKALQDEDAKFYEDEDA